MLKTYIRKRQDNKLIEDVQALCRLCLARVLEPVPIFERAGNVCAALPMRIMICVGYEISQEDCLPNTICTNCHQELERYYKFRKKCEQSYLKLKSHYNATKCKQVPPDIIKDEECKVESELNQGLEDMQIDEMDPLDISHVFNYGEQKVYEEPVLNMAAVSDTDVNVEECVEETTEIQVIEQTHDVNPDISTFLNAILVELGILVRDEAGLMVQDQGVSSFELVTGDDDQLVFELIEEDETEEATIQEATVSVTPAETSPQVIDSKPEKDKKVRTLKNSGADKKTALGAWCEVCGRTFSCRSAARRHGAVHSGARPHVCALCGKGFAQKVVMERHRLLHSESRPYQCAKCPKSFTQRGALAAHARAHAPPHARALTLHACTHCDRMFLYASGLSRHMMTHNGRVFECDACDRLFNDRSSLLRHFRNAHPHEIAPSARGKGKSPVKIKPAKEKKVPSPLT